MSGLRINARIKLSWHDREELMLTEVLCSLELGRVIMDQIWICLSINIKSWRGDQRPLLVCTSIDDDPAVSVGELSKDPNHGTEVRFSPKTVKSLTFRVTGVKPGTQNAGLAEIAVYRVQH